MIRLKSLEKEDLFKFIEWSTNKSAEDLLQWAGPIYDYPLTLAQVENYFSQAEKSNSNIFIYKILFVDTNEIIGTIELREIDKEQSIGKVCRFLVGEDKMRGKGIGKKALNEVLRIAFEDMKFQKIVLSVFDFNHSAIRCYENIGFKKEKLMKNVRKSLNGYWNSYEMGISKFDWKRMEF